MVGTGIARLLEEAERAATSTQALAYCDRILKRSPFHLAALELKLKALWRAGEYKSALNAAEDIDRTNRGDPACEFIKGDCYQNLLHYNHAAACYQKCAVSDNADIAAHAKVRIEALAAMQSGLICEMLISDRAFSRRYAHQPSQALSEYGFSSDLLTACPTQTKLINHVCIWVRPS